jgi:hypothetical protein
VRSSKTDVELAAGVQVYSDPASTLRTMAHKNPASQDVGLTPIQETSGKRQSPTLMDLDIQDRGHQLLRIPLPRNRVNKGKKCKGRSLSGSAPSNPQLLGSLQRIAMTLTRWHASPRGYALIHDSGAQPVDDYQFCSW